MGLKCPKCACPASEGEVFCSVCGGELPAGTPGSAGDAPEKEPAIPDNAATLRLDGILQEPDSGGAAFRTASAASRPPAVPALPVAPPAAADLPSHCSDFKVLYNTGKVFVEGMVVPFDFRLTPQVEGLDSLFVEIRYNGAAVARCDPDEYLVKGEELEIHLTFTAPGGLQGQVPFDVYVGYQKQDAALTFVCHKVHTCFRAKDKSRKVIDALKIELNNTIHNSGNASDAQINPVIKGLEAFCPAPDDPAEGFQYITLPPVWIGLPLRRAQVKPGSGPVLPKPLVQPAEARLDRLTLRWAGRRVQLIGGDRVQFGRKRLCQIVTRLERRSGQTEKEFQDANYKISNFHCHVECGPANVLLKDGGWDSVAQKVKVASMNGTFVDGEKVQPARPRVLPVDKPFTLSLADADIHDPDVLSYDGEVWSCGRMGSCLACAERRNPGQPACLVLRRRHGTPETIVLLWKQVDLARIESAWGPGCICREREGFLLHLASRCDWLVPERSVRLQGHEVRSEPYNAPGLAPDAGNI